MILDRPNVGALKLDPAALAVLVAHRQLRASDAEAGGVLMGRLLTGSDDVVVDEATAPTSADRRGRFSFWRAKEPAQQRVNDAWHASAGTCQYLGEWHSHPEPHPTPSTRDLKEWRKVLRATRNAPPHLYFAIIGQVSLAIWEGECATGTLVQLQERPDRLHDVLSSQHDVGVKHDDPLDGARG